MKRLIAVLLGICMLLMMFCGCKDADTDSSNISNGSDVEIFDESSIYAQFIDGKITATDSDGYKYYINQYNFLDDGFSYAYYDVDSDNVEELCVKNLQLYIFDVKDGEIYNLYTETRANTTILNDGGLFQVKYGAEPDHIYYDYKKINQNGEIETQLYFSWWDAQTTDGTESYYINEESVTKKEYELLWTKHSNFADDKVFWATVSDKDDKTTPQDTQNQQDYTDSQDEYKDEYVILIENIETEYDEALNNALSTADMCDVHIEYAHKWKEIADEYYNKLIEDEGLKPYIIELKSDWEVYYNSQIENYRNIYSEIFEGGSLTGVLFDSLKCDLQKDWAMQLINIYRH